MWSPYNMVQRSRDDVATGNKQRHSDVAEAKTDR